LLRTWLLYKRLRPAQNMPSNRFYPRLNKRRLLSHEDFIVYSVNAFSVRNVAQPDEEFTNFATQEEFKNLIPKREIWIAEKNVTSESVFFIANSLARMKALARGRKEDAAYEAGLTVERFLREQLTGIKYRDGKPHAHVPEDIYVGHYLTLPDPKSKIEVWVVDGNLVRSYYKTDYTEGGHGYVYPWVPKNQIWIEKAIDRQEFPYIAAHEYIEVRLMRDKHIDYDRAHEICSKVEFKLRNSQGLTPLVCRRRHLTKVDLPHLTRQECFDYVLNHHVKK
jgi:hypothetical protein